MFNTLTIFFIISLGIILSFIFTDNLQAPTQWLSSTFTAVTNLSYGYCASYFFYVVNIYLPQKKEVREKENEIAQCIAKAEVNIKNFGEVYGIPLQHKFHNEAVDALLAAPPNIFFHYGNFDLANVYTAYIALGHIIQDTIILFHEALEHSSHLSSTDRLRLQNVTILISEQYRFASLENFYAAISSLTPESLIHEIHEVSYRLYELRTNNKFAPHIFRKIDIIKLKLERDAKSKQMAPSEDLRLALKKQRLEYNKNTQNSHSQAAAASEGFDAPDITSQQTEFASNPSKTTQVKKMQDNPLPNLAPHLQPFKIMEAYLIETLKGVRTSTQHAMRVVFLVSSVGSISLLFYLTQTKGSTPLCVFEAFRALIYSTILSIILAGYNSLASTVSSSMLLKITTEMNFPDLEKNGKRVRLMWGLAGIGYIIWSIAFYYICTAAYLLLPHLTPSIFN